MSVEVAQMDAVGRLGVAIQRIDRLKAALKPFADAVYNDNGNMTITPCSISDYAKAYFTMRDLEK